MSGKFYGKDGLEIDCQDVAQYDYDTALDEMNKTLALAAVVNPGIAAVLGVLLDIVKENMHWLYSKPGEHPAVSELLAPYANAAMDEQHNDIDDNISLGLPPETKKTSD